MMKETISKLGSYFNSQRMMRRYAAKAYHRKSATNLIIDRATA